MQDKLSPMKMSAKGTCYDNACAKHLLPQLESRGYSQRALSDLEHHTLAGLRIH